MPQRPVLPTPRSDLEIVITDDGSRTLRFAGSDVTFHSESGALAESDLVFLRNSGIAQRLQLGQPSRVLELGLGTGLNFWITASLAFQTHTGLHYLSVEPSLMDWNILELLEHGKLTTCQPGFNHFSQAIFSQSSRQTQIEPVSFERLDRLDDLPANSGARFDAIYHDPFSPEVAPDLWSGELFARLRTLLQPSGRLVTYCVKSMIQRTLKQAGFRIEKTRGPVGGKREVLIAFPISTDG